MFSISDKEHQLLRQLGEGLRQRRKERASSGETQATFAARLGVSAPTLRKMEKGQAGTPIEYWIRAADLFGELGQLQALFAPAPEAPFAKRSRRMTPKE